MPFKKPAQRSALRASKPPAPPRDEAMFAALAEVEARIKARLDTIEARLLTRADTTEMRLDVIEARLMARINDSNERVLERMRGLDLSVLALTEIARSTNTLLGVLANNIGDIGDRVRRLEGK